MEALTLSLDLRIFAFYAALLMGAYATWYIFNVPSHQPPSRAHVLLLLCVTLLFLAW